MTQKGFHHSEESKKKMSKSRKGKKLSEETKWKVGLASKGRIKSEETRRKISEGGKGKHTGPMTLEVRKHMSEAKKGKPKTGKALQHIQEINARKRGVPLSEETKRKLSESKKGRPSWNKGKKASEETRRKISEHHRHYQSDEAKQKISKIHKGRKLSDERRVAISKRLVGNQYSLGHKHSEETCKVISEKALKRFENKENHPCFGRKHTIEALEKMSIAQQNRPPPSKETRKKMSDYRKVHPTRGLYIVGKSKPTKPQLKLLEVIKINHPNEEVFMDHQVKTIDGFKFIDVAIPKLMLGWEYDCPYWHQNKEKDRRRHEVIEAEGWSLTHYSDISEFS